jgi:putative tail protein
MGNLFGKPAQANVPTQLNSINVDESRYGDPVPLVYGVQRIKMTLLWYGDFSSTAQYSNSGKGGKGPPSSYAYNASCVMGLCEGPIAGIRDVWVDKDLTTLETLGLTLFTGEGGQAPWPYLVDNFPNEAVPYDHTAYVAEAGLSLGGSAAMPNYDFEVYGFFASPGIAMTLTGGVAQNGYTAQLSSASTGIVADGLWTVSFSDWESRTCQFTTVSGVTTLTWPEDLGLAQSVTANIIVGGLDADPSQILLDYCTDPNHGANFNNLSSTIQGTGATTWQTYCLANGLFLSPYEDTQRAGTDFLKDILEITNSNGVMSAGVYYIVPYGDTPITGNGRNFVPNLTPLFSLNDDDFMPNKEGDNDDPVVMIRKSVQNETFNVVRVEFLDRGNAYNVSLAEWADPLDQAVNGIRVMGNKTFHQICDASVANQVAALIGQRQLYVRNRYQFTVRADYSILEPMDIIEITDSNLGITNLLVRITETQDDEDDTFTITAEDMLLGSGSAPRYNFSTAAGYNANFATLPFAVAAPIIFSVPPPLVPGGNGGYALAVAVGPGTTVYGGGTDGDYGGCDAYASLDTDVYNYVGRVNGAARIGTLTGAINATVTSAVMTLSAGAQALGLQLNSASSANFAANRALMYLDGEIIGYETCSLGSPGVYTVTISRGLFGTGPSPGVGIAHANGAKWTVLDETILYMNFDPGMIGQTLSLQFTSYNSVGRAEQSLSEATVYTYVIENLNIGQLLGGPLNLSGVGMGIVGNSMFKSALTTASWDSGAWSEQSYANGAFVSWQPTQSNLGFFVGLHHSSGLSGNLDNLLDFTLYCTSSGTLVIYECWTGTAVSLGTVGTYSTGDVLLVTYDGNVVRYLQNGLQLHQTSPTNGPMTLFLNSCFYTTQAACTNIQFGPFSMTAPAQFVARGNAVVSDSNGKKVGGTNGWDSDGYSMQGFPTCNLSWKASQTTGNFMGALCTAVPQSPGFSALNYAIQCGSSGDWQIYESGTGVAGYSGTYTDQDYFAITYNGTTLTYWQNNISLRVVSVSGLTLFADFVFYAPNCEVGSINWGPGSQLPLVDTGQIGDQAATSVSVSTVTNVNVANSDVGTLTEIDSIAIGPFSVATTVVISVSGQWQTPATGSASEVAVFGVNDTSTGSQIEVTTNGNSNNGVMALEATFTLAANTTQTYYLTGIGLPDSESFASWTVLQVTMKAETIKK